MNFSHGHRVHIFHLTMKHRQIRMRQETEDQVSVDSHGLHTPTEQEGWLHVEQASKGYQV